MSAASPARVHDHLLGGKDNYLADRRLVAELLELQPNLRTAARANRAFLGRAVAALAALGVDQFLDVGCGLPTRDNVHQMAARRLPGARTVYLDNDPAVVAHARALMAADAGVEAMTADLRKPEELLGLAAGSLDWRRPVALVLTAVLHLLPDADGPAAIVAALRGALPPGSALVVSHLTAPLAPGVADLYAERCGVPLTVRPPATLLGYLGGWPLLPPGLAPTAAWQHPLPPPDPAACLSHGAVALSPARG
ncbi:SAM-dependent methyltransferase [Actinomadura parmotrematis]|uniref:SAM-dependent methyltransferase n=1 Tax=Actinomadura parmotrematis TaxID=2864039 RepID=A0ABS7FNA6_9ACTN|nr:SAM-dependent methyltransferase [Actinomadura parmotrematis]